MDKSGIVKVVNGGGATVYHSVNGSATGKKLKFNDNYRYDALNEPDFKGRYWFRVGGNEWVCEEEVSAKVSSAKLAHGILTVKSAGATVRYSLNGSVNVNNRHLAGNTKWQYNSIAIDSWNTTWYNVGYGQWINGNDIQKNGDGNRVKISFYDPAVLGSNMGYGGVAANLTIYPKGTRLRIELDKPLKNGTKILERIVNDTGTFVNTNPYQIDIALPNREIPSYGVTSATIYVI